MCLEAEITRRTKAALSAILASLEAQDDEFGVGLFARHHIEKISQDYWKSHLISGSPDPQKVVQLLILHEHWSEDLEEGGLDNFDFTLPGEITNYVISVRFDEAGEVAHIAVES